MEQSPVPEAPPKKAMTEIGAAAPDAIKAATKRLGSDFPDGVATPIIEMTQRRQAVIQGHLND